MNRRLSALIVAALGSAGLLLSFQGSAPALVGEIFLYDNSGTFAVERQDYRAAVEYRFLESFVAGLAFRSVDFSQGGTTFNDYDARILDLSVGYRW